MYFQIFLALIIGLMTGYLYFSKSKSSIFSLGEDILLLGLNGSGKTTLFYKLKSSQVLETCTSTEPNKNWIRPVDSDGSPLTHDSHFLVDLPGHEKLNNINLNKYLPNSKGAIFLIDSLSFNKSIVSVSGLLYDVLTHPNFSNLSDSGTNYSILFLLTKTDLAFGVSVDKVKIQLENELNKLRFTRTSQLESIGDESLSTTFLGFEDKDFEFSDLESSFSFEFKKVNLLVDKNEEDTAILDVADWLNRL